MGGLLVAIRHLCLCGLFISLVNVLEWSPRQWRAVSDVRRSVGRGRDGFDCILRWLESIRRSIMRRRHSRTIQFAPLNFRRVTRLRRRRPLVTLAVVPIFINAGTAVLPTLLAAVAGRRPCCLGQAY